MIGSERFIQAFLNQLEYDKDYARDTLCFQMHVNADQLGRVVFWHDRNLVFHIFSPTDIEFLEFIDGNGFRIELYEDDIYLIYPIYKHEVIDNESLCNRSV